MNFANCCHLNPTFTVFKIFVSSTMHQIQSYPTPDLRAALNNNKRAECMYKPSGSCSICAALPAGSKRDNLPETLKSSNLGTSDYAGTEDLPPTPPPKPYSFSRTKPRSANKNPDYRSIKRQKGHGVPQKRVVYAFNKQLPPLPNKPRRAPPPPPIQRQLEDGANPSRPISPKLQRDISKEIPRKSSKRIQGSWQESNAAPRKETCIDVAPSKSTHGRAESQFITDSLEAAITPRFCPVETMYDPDPLAKLPKRLIRSFNTQAGPPFSLIPLVPEISPENSSSENKQQKKLSNKRHFFDRSPDLNPINNSAPYSRHDNYCISAPNFTRQQSLDLSSFSQLPGTSHTSRIQKNSNYQRPLYLSDPTLYNTKPLNIAVRPKPRAKSADPTLLSSSAAKKQLQEILDLPGLESLCSQIPHASAWKTQAAAQEAPETATTMKLPTALKFGNGENTNSLEKLTAQSATTLPSPPQSPEKLSHPPSLQASKSTASFFASFGNAKYRGLRPPSVIIPTDMDMILENTSGIDVGYLSEVPTLMSRGRSNSTVSGDAFSNRMSLLSECYQSLQSLHDQDSTSPKSPYSFHFSQSASFSKSTTNIFLNRAEDLTTPLPTPTWTNLSHPSPTLTPPPPPIPPKSVSRLVSPSERLPVLVTQSPQESQFPFNNNRQSTFSRRSGHSVRKSLSYGSLRSPQQQQQQQIASLHYHKYNALINDPFTDPALNSLNPHTIVMSNPNSPSIPATTETPAASSPEFTSIDDVVQTFISEDLAVLDSALSFDSPFDILLSSPPKLGTQSKTVAPETFSLKRSSSINNSLSLSRGSVLSDKQSQSGSGTHGAPSSPIESSSAASPLTPQLRSCSSSIYDNRELSPASSVALDRDSFHSNKLDNTTGDTKYTLSTSSYDLASPDRKSMSTSMSSTSGIPKSLQTTPTQQQNPSLQKKVSVTSKLRLFGRRIVNHS